MPFVLLDTNALLLPFRERFPLLPEVERLAGDRVVGVPESVLRELERLGGSAAFAVPALELAQRFPSVPTEGSGDDAIFDCARRCGAWVVTADRALAERLLAAGVTVLSPRGKQRLALRPGDRGRS